MTDVGTLVWIQRYPVKSLRGERLHAVQILQHGIPGDRAQCFVVQSGHARVGKAYRGKENERLHLIANVEEARLEARTRGVELSVESEGGPFYDDDAPISLLFDRWLDGLSAHVGYAVEPERFRPNLFVRGEDGFAFDEDELVGRTLDVGDVRLVVREPTKRCVVTTYHPAGAARPDPRILRFIAQERDAKLGVYCDVVRAGTARIGDSVRFAAR